MGVKRLHIEHLLPNFVGQNEPLAVTLQVDR